MKKSFLDYYKTILEKVSFDKDLLKREYQKAMQTLGRDESNALRIWLRKKEFGYLLIK